MQYYEIDERCKSRQTIKPFVMKNIILILALALASSVNAQLCGQRFDADLSISYDAVVKYYHQDGTLDWECTVENTNFLLIPSCATQVSYIIDLLDDEKLLDTFIVQYKNGSPVVTHRESSGLIQCLQVDY
jgi:hypothetical protein